MLHIRVKAIGEENFGEKASVSAYARYIFGVSARKILWITYDSPNLPIFLHQNFPVYSILQLYQLLLGMQSLLIVIIVGHLRLL